MYKVMSAPITEGLCNKCCQTILQNEKYVNCTICGACFHLNCCDANENREIFLSGNVKRTVYNCNDCIGASNDLATTVSLLTNKLNDQQYHPKSPTVGMRHVQALMLFLCVLTMYLSRLNVSLAVVAMTSAATTNPDFPEFDWSEKQISYILSSFFWGYVCFQFPGGMLSKRFGAKRVMGLAMSLLTILTATTPWCVGWGGWQVFCAIRVMQGMAQGVLYPCIFDHLAKWSPSKERNRLGGFTLTGVDCGAILAMSMSGAIAESPMGWPGIYYVSAAVCLTWCILWFIFSASNPHESRFITEAEKHYIKTSLAHEEGFHNKKIPIPWKAILTSIPVFAFIIARCTIIYGLSTFQAQIPSYLFGVLDMKIKANGIVSAMPFMASFLMSYVYVAIADYLQRKEILSLRALRRTFNTAATCIPALGMIGMGFLDKNHISWALALMTITVGSASTDIIGSALNVMDLTTNHAGFLISISMTTCGASALISPLVVGTIVTDVTNRSQWQIVFAICAAIYVIGNLVYCTLGSAKTQPWDADDFLLPKDAEASSSVNESSDKSDSVSQRKDIYSAEI